MPIEGEKLDELLSGLLDDQLTDAERNWVEQLLGSDPTVRQRVEALRQQRLEVAELGSLTTRASQRRRQSGFADSLAAVVIARAREQADQLGLAPDHHVYGVRSATAIRPATSQRDRNFAGRNLWLGLATAAALLLALGLLWRAPWQNALPVANSNRPPAAPAVPAPAVPRWSESQSPASESLANQSPTEDPQASRPVGQFGQLAYVLVVDVQMTAEGLRKQVLEDVLTGAGIPQSGPVLANGDILAALEQSQMIVNPQSEPAEQIYLTVVHAEMQDLDAALQNIWKDTHHFPRVSLNIAIDARAALVREILNSAAEKFTLSDSFAVPVTTDSQPPQLAGSSPFPGASDGVQYISSSRRANGWGGSDALAVPASETAATVLLVTHLVN